MREWDGGHTVVVIVVVIVVVVNFTPFVFLPAVVFQFLPVSPFPLVLLDEFLFDLFDLLIPVVFLMTGLL